MSRNDRRFRRSIFSMLKRAGRARSPQSWERAAEVFELLENRVLLAGDEPGFNQVFNTPNPITPPQITIDPATGIGTGVTGQGSSVIGTAGDDDVFRFTALTNDFVRIWGDANSSNSPLDSRVEVYTGTLGGGATLVASGSTQGSLTAGTLKDGWAGFRAIQGQEYFVVVKSDVLSGAGSTGDYTLRISTKSLAFPTPSASTGVASVNGTLTIAGGDVMYKMVLPSGAGFRGLMTIQAEAVATDLDPRLDIYVPDDSLPSGVRFIVADSDSGNLSDSYLAAVSQPNAVYYIRVRSDEFGNPNLRPSTGNFTVVVDAIPTTIAIDAVTRVSPTVGGALATQKDTILYSFTAQGTGLSFISLWGVPLPPLTDSFLHVYNEQASEIGTNDLPGANSRMLINLVGGTRYFLVVDTFNAGGGGNFRVQIEAHHTFDIQTVTPDVDDHANNPGAGGSAQQWDAATPVVWSAPRNATVPAGLEGLQPPLPDPGADHVKVQLGTGQGRIHAGGDTDLFQFVPPIDMLSDFLGQEDPTTYVAAPVNKTLAWLPNFRPSSRLQITGYATDGFLAAPVFRILDSNHQVIFTSSEVIANTGVYGGLDPASLPPNVPIQVYGYTLANNQPTGIKVWGGEVYYLEVTAGGTGRYTFNIQVDAPTDTQSDLRPTVPAAGSFATAWEVRLDANSGDGRNYINAAAATLNRNNEPVYSVNIPGGVPALQGRGYAMNVIRPTPPAAGAGATVANLVGNPGSRGALLLQLSDFGNITSATDTDLYQFRAVYTGTAEIRINTTQLADEFWDASVLSYEFNADPTNTTTLDPIPMVPNYVRTVTPATKPYDSALDAALRIFDNDQTQIAYVNDNSVTGGESDVTSMGQFGDRTFQRRDPRVVINVEAGKTYYIQVESGQRSNFTLTFPKVDWRHVIGSYELMVNSMPNLNFDDDHINANAAGSVVQATPLVTNLSTSSPTAIIGTAVGEIDNTFANADDTDAFTFISPGNGTANFTVSTRAGDSFARTVTIFDSNATQLATQNGTGTADITISLPALQGDRFFIVVDGNEGAGGAFEGRYTVKASGVPFVDDYASEDSFVNATVIPKDNYDYDRTETINGAIETTGDSDIFSFDALTFDLATVSVQGAPGFSPVVRVYEVSIDPSGNPIRLLIANNGPAAVGGTLASVTFSVSAPPRQTGVETYPSYFIVVAGLDPNVDKGTYAVTLSVNIGTDDHPDGPNPPPPGTPVTAGQWSLATTISPGPTGNGGSSGVIEAQGDTDLFTFTLPAQGQVIVSLVSPTASHLLPRIRVIDENFNPVTDITTSLTFVTGPDEANSVATFTFTGARDARFFVMVEGVIGTGNQFKTDDFGSYFLTITVPVPDDHPNVGEFPIADDIPISPFSGAGSSSGLISPSLDTDLFKFTDTLAGNMVITVSTPGSAMTPVLRLFAPDQSEIGTAVVDGGAGDDDGQVNGSVTRHITIAAGSTYFVLVSSDPNGIQASGSYIVTLNGPTPNIGPDDHANAGDFDNATLIPLDQTTGDGTHTGNIEIPNDTDLFYFISLAGTTNQPLPAFIQIVTPNGQALDVGIRIIRQDRVTELAADTAGGPGFNAGVTFPIDAAGERFYIEVDGLGNLTGGYTVRVDTSPESFVLYYPAGESSDAIREYISIGNANTYDVDYTITLRFEDSLIAPLQFTGSIGAGRRGGITLSDGDPTTTALVPANKPYSIIIDSNGFLGANISHYVSGDSQGEVFAGHASTTWTFAKAQKIHGQVEDQLVTYNPNAGAARVTLNAYTPGGSLFTISQTVQGFSRLTWDFDSIALLPVGQFAFTLTSTPLNGVDPHVGIVAALNHKDLANVIGYAVLGDSGGGTTTGVIAGLVDSGNLTPSQKSEVTFYNSSNGVASITLRGKYLNSGIPDLLRVISLNPHQSITLTGTQLGLVANQVIGLRYTSNVKVTVLESTERFGDADASQAQAEAGTRWYFGDAFINRLKAGSLYFENMYFYNPASSAISVQLKFIFASGTPETTYTFNIAAGNYATVALHQLAAILNHAVFNYFSIEASSAAPFVVSMTHYDLVLDGGWGTQGAPLGLTNSIESIS